MSSKFRSQFRSLLQDALARRVRRWLWMVATVAALAPSVVPARELPADLAALDWRVCPADSPLGVELASMVESYWGHRLRQANQRSTAEWMAIRDRQDWDASRAKCLKALRDSLGEMPKRPDKLAVLTTRNIHGEGYVIENLLFQSRPGLIVSANLYAPAEARESMPGILICHSHHNAKTQGELQEMGITWARQGCLVLVMDQLGHGERRQHPFIDAASFPAPFRVGRQDYFFRYITALQLASVGESLMGWMTWDLMRGVDLLLARPGIDPKRIALLGAVAGGGDPAAVTGALDERIAATVPFNFGGPQPESPYPLPEDAETTFPFAGSGSWESTRNLYRSAEMGFLPWQIVGSIAPRGLIHGHEFSWDRERDPVWHRLERIFELYDARDHLHFAHGRGTLRGSPPESTHCNNIGAEHRHEIHQAFRRWFDIKVPMADAPERHTFEELACVTADLAPEWRSRRLHELLAGRAHELDLAVQQRLAGKTPAERRQVLQDAWAEILGTVEPVTAATVELNEQQMHGSLIVQRLALRMDSESLVPCLLFMPSATQGPRNKVVIALAQQGKRGFLNHRADELVHLTDAGIVVCLVDLHGTGETEPDSARGRTSYSTDLAASALMLGESMIGTRLHDLRGVLRFLQSLPEFEQAQWGLWADSLTVANPDCVVAQVPLDVEPCPGLAEPGAALVALLTALFEDSISAVHVRGGLDSFESLLQSQFCYVPMDATVPGALRAGDLKFICSVLAPRRVRLVGMVNGLNYAVSPASLRDRYRVCLDAYREAREPDRFDFYNDVNDMPDSQIAEFFQSALAK